MCLSTGLPIPGSNTDGDLYDVDIYDIDYSYSSSVIADLQSKGKKVVCSLQRQIDHLACITLSSFFFFVCTLLCFAVVLRIACVPAPAVFLQPCSSNFKFPLSDLHRCMYW